MISIYGRSSAAAPPRKHYHFVPDGYIPPKSRQKIVSPPQRTTPRPILKSPGSSRTNTPSRRTPNYPNSRVSPQLLRKGASSCGNPNVPRQRPQSFPHIIIMPKSILKTSKVHDTHVGSSSVGVSTPRAKSAGTSPHCSAMSQSPAGSQQQQGCYVGVSEDYTPASRQKKAPLQKKVLESVGRGPYDRSYMGNPISVVDKYDERDNPILWKGMYNPGRRRPPAKSSLRPHARHPNILFNRVDGDTASCSTQSCKSSEENDQELQEEEDCRNFEPCCRPMDWDHDPKLKSIASEERQAYRQCKLEDYLREICTRQCDPPERFANYLIRCYAYANEELNSNKSKHLLGYAGGHLSSLDVWVLRLHRGTVSRLLRSGTAFSGRDNDLFLSTLREECVALGSVMRRHLNETERRVEACNEQERNYMKILILSQRSPMGVMQNLKRRDWR